MQIISRILIKTREVKNMSISEIITIIAGILIPTLTGFFILGKKIGCVDDMKTEIKEITSDIKKIWKSIGVIDGKTARLFETKSPIRLQERGIEILNESGLKKYIDENKSNLVGLCRNQKTKNPYDLQIAIFDLLDDFEFPKNKDDEFKIFAYNNGISMDMLKRVGAIYLRDVCFEEMKINVGEIDRHNPNNKSE